MYFAPGYRTGGQNARVVGPAQNDADIAFFAQRQEAVERLLLQQRVTPGQKEPVKIPQTQQAFADLPFIDAGADRSDFAGLTQFTKAR